VALAGDTGKSGLPICHVAIVGGCEGEAILFANWVLHRRGDLERVVGGHLVSLSWLATDIAPVGHFSQATLRGVAVDAPVWVVVTLSSRFTYCAVTALLTETLLAARRVCVLVGLDLRADNVTIIDASQAEPPDRADLVSLERASFPEHPGGLFRSSLLQDLLANVD
jgi:hypothetical protein